MQENPVVDKTIKHAQSEEVFINQIEVR